MGMPFLFKSRAQKAHYHFSKHPAQWKKLKPNKKKQKQKKTPTGQSFAMPSSNGSWEMSSSAAALWPTETQRFYYKRGWG